LAKRSEKLEEKGPKNKREENRESQPHVVSVRMERKSFLP